MERRTKIIATLGPASQSEARLAELIQAGVDVARLNFSHGSHSDHARAIENIRRLGKQIGRPVTILQDLQGPKIRVGEIAKGSATLQAGSRFRLTTRPLTGDETIASVDYTGLPSAVQPGARILLDDGALELRVTTVNGEEVETTVVVGGRLRSHKGVNLPGTHLDIPILTDKDISDLAFGLEHGVDAVAISFVRSAEDVLQVRETIQKLAGGADPPTLIAKLEKAEALDNLEEILTAADGVMVARGDLGVETAPETVPIAQKRIIAAANQSARYVITATQMLESMIEKPRPTRAEASDVANAIFDGSDAVMLSGETAIGKYPLEAVKVMDAIIRQAEEHIGEPQPFWGQQERWASSQDDAVFVTMAARELARDRNVTAIAVFTKSGRTALLMSKARPGVPILAFTPNERTYYRMGLFWGVTPLLVPHSESIEEMLAVVDRVMRTSGSVQSGQQVVLVCGFPVDQPCPANLALLHTVGMPCD